jgi:hypothetical protein
VLNCDAERALIGLPAVSQLLIESIDRAARAQKLFRFLRKGTKREGNGLPLAASEELIEELMNDATPRA